MSSRSRIGYYDQETGKIVETYCHDGGALNANGLILHKYYCDLDTVEELVAGGEMSCLDAPGDSDYYEEDELGIVEHLCQGSKDEVLEFFNLLYKEDVMIENAYLYIENNWYAFTFEDEYELLSEAIKDIELPDWYQE